MTSAYLISLAAALPAERRVSARQGLAGEKSGLFEHPAQCAPVVLDVRTIEFPPCHNNFSAACQALEDLVDFPLTRYPHDLFLLRIWELRHNVTAYDAAYIALAEALGAPMLTRDAALATAPGNRARIELV